MTAPDLLHNLSERGVTIQISAGQISLSAEPGVLDEADIAAVRALKPALIDLLTRPAHGSINDPMVVYGRRLKACPWHDCEGATAARGDLHLCLTCNWYFRLVPTEGEYE
jgi:hypothetical protein